MYILKNILIIVLAVAFSACNNNCIIKMTDSDIIGNWVGSFDRAENKFKHSSLPSPNILFRKDHSFEAKNIPLFIGNSWEPELFNFTGSWTIQHENDESKSYQVLLDYTLNGIHWGQSLPIGNYKKRVGLKLGIDPNLNTEILFYKEK